MSCADAEMKRDKWKLLIWQIIVETDEEPVVWRLDVKEVGEESGDQTEESLDPALYCRGEDT